MANKDYYKILGVKENDSLADIKKAYRSLALKYHPDRCPEEKKNECEEKFKEITEAYYVLGEEKRRKEYDEVRRGASSFTGANQGQGFASQAGFDFEDIMRHFHDLGAGHKGSSKRENQYFFFDDLADIFGDLGSFEHSDGQGYRVYNFANNNAHQKVDTNIYASLDVPRDITIKGGEAQFKLNNGKMITLKINPNTKSGQKMRLKRLGKSCPTCDHSGDLIITINHK